MTSQHKPNPTAANDEEDDEAGFGAAEGTASAGTKGDSAKERTQMLKDYEKSTGALGGAAFEQAKKAANSTGAQEEKSTTEDSEWNDSGNTNNDDYAPVKHTTLSNDAGGVVDDDDDSASAGVSSRVNASAGPNEQ
eukprot:TRINITY_DN1479_c0_g1_i1.p1 TRINITY_DN1479_c0_g1~~TRINITY_DN1479_c0_g1_i1.p1  ORF type:complete len:136 (+),score=66.44 TRINITY_DN1479_c0_g1_i1:37-444(+)